MKKTNLNKQVLFDFDNKASDSLLDFAEKLLAKAKGDKNLFVDELIREAIKDMNLPEEDRLELKEIMNEFLEIDAARLSRLGFSTTLII